MTYLPKTSTMYYDRGKLRDKNGRGSVGTLHCADDIGVTSQTIVKVNPEIRRDDQGRRWSGRKRSSRRKRPIGGF